MLALRQSHPMVYLSLATGHNPAGCSKSSSSKAAASEGPEAYPLGYVEDLNDARTPLADFFSILLGTFWKVAFRRRAGQFAVLQAVSHVDHNADDTPNGESNPGHPWEKAH
jgi:hypothetical protein